MKHRQVKRRNPHSVACLRQARNYVILFLSVALTACVSTPVKFPVAESTVTTRAFTLPPGDDVIGDLAIITTKRGDTLPDIARHFSLGHNDIAEANPNVDVWVPHAGARVLLPLQFVLPDEAPRQGIVLNVATMRIYYYPDDALDNRVFTYPVGIGREGWATPTGHMRIIEKKEQPDWRVPASIRKEHAQMGDPLPPVVPAGPDNPLGEFAMRLTRPEYLIHGTNKPYGIGMRVSHGCVRLYPEDIQPLFQSVKLRTDVHLIDQPYLLGWRGDTLYLEAHPPLQKSDRKLKKLISALVRKIEHEEQSGRTTIDWDRVERIVINTSGIPEPISIGAESLPQIVASSPRVRHPGTFYGTPKTPPLTNDGWYVDAGTFTDPVAAKRVATIFNHQGPQIPAHSISRDGAYKVIAGPFESAHVAKIVSERIKREFEHSTQILPPGKLRS